ncbi:MAG: transcriptional regulator [candidate division Zixibacteria bacterium]|nr:transcriptional regulator [candidate division Zixibacteria bacterium]
MALLFVVEQADFLFVKNQTCLTAGNLSSHLSKLEAAGYISIKKKFVGKTPKTFLKLTKMGRIAFDAYRNKMKALFTASF